MDIQTAWEIESKRVEDAWHAEQARCEAGEQASALYIATWNELADEYGFAHIMSKNEPCCDGMTPECCETFPNDVDDESIAAQGGCSDPF